MSDGASTGTGGQDPLTGLLERLPGSLGLDSAQLAWLGEESTRVAGNLLVLLRQGWPEMAVLGGRMALFALGGALLAGVLAALVGWLLYFVVAGPLLRRGWRTGRLLGCFAAGAVLLWAGMGGAWAGLWLGAGRVAEEAIEERYVVERLAVATFLAFTLGEEELPQGVGTDRVEELLERAQSGSRDSWDAFRARAGAAVESGFEPPGWLRPELMVEVVARLGGGAAPDLGALHEVLAAPSPAAGDDPLPQTASIRRRAVELLRAAVYTQVVTGLGFGLLLPPAALALLGLLGTLLRRGRPQGAGGPAV